MWSAPGGSASVALRVCMCVSMSPCAATADAATRSRCFFFAACRSSIIVLHTLRGYKYIRSRMIARYFPTVRCSVSFVQSLTDTT